MCVCVRVPVKFKQAEGRVYRPLQIDHNGLLQNPSRFIVHNLVAEQEGFAPMTFSTMVIRDSGYHNASRDCPQPFEENTVVARWSKLLPLPSLTFLPWKI